MKNLRWREGEIPQGPTSMEQLCCPCLYKDLQFLIADVTPVLKQEGPADPCNNRSFCHCHVLSISQPFPYARRELRWEKYFYNRAWSYQSLVFPCCLLIPVQLGLWELKRMEEQSGYFLLIKTPYRNIYVSILNPHKKPYVFNTQKTILLTSRANPKQMPC